MSDPIRNGAFRAARQRRASGGAAKQAQLTARVRLTLCLTFLAAVTAGGTPNVHAGAPSLGDGAETYRHSLTEDLGRALAGATLMRERMEMGDADGAKRAWIDARIGWERSEVFTSGFVPDLDQEIDAWPNAKHGFHGIEAILFAPNAARADAKTGARKEAGDLIAHLAQLHAQIRGIPLPPQRLLNGVARLAYEVGGNKADGGESRLSGTSLNDMQSNADGVALAWRVVFSSAVAAAAPQLDQQAQAVIGRMKAAVQVPSLRNLDVEKLRADSEELVAILERAAPAIGLDKPALEDAEAPWRDYAPVMPIPRD